MPSVSSNFENAIKAVDVAALQSRVLHLGKKDSVQQVTNHKMRYICCSESMQQERTNMVRVPVSTTKQ